MNNNDTTQFEYYYKYDKRIKFLVSQINNLDILLKLNDTHFRKVCKILNDNMKKFYNFNLNKEKQEHRYMYNLNHYQFKQLDKYNKLFYAFFESYEHISPTNRP